VTDIPSKKETYNAYINFTSNIESADNVQNLETQIKQNKEKMFPYLLKVM
jgi:hypothetical protein